LMINDQLLTPQDIEQIRVMREVVHAEVREILLAEVREIIRAEVREIIRAEIAASEERMQEFARGIETNLLISFHGYGKDQAARLHAVEITYADLAPRMAALEERVVNLET
jgi:hypothetical protein